MSRRQQSGDHAFGGAAADSDLALRIYFEIVEAAVGFADRVAQRLRSPGDGILIPIVRNRLLGRCFDFSGSGKIRKALREIYRAPQEREPRHLANDGFAELADAVALKTALRDKGHAAILAKHLDETDFANFASASPIVHLFFRVVWRLGAGFE